MAEPLKLTFRPGINRETTDYGNTGGWYDINLVRWVSQTPQSMGGWQPFTESAAEGTFRSLFPWSTLNGTRFYGAGTNLKYYLVYGNSLVDITPTQKTTFRDYDNVSHDLLPSDLVQMGLQVMARIQAVYQKAWALKAISPIPADYADDSHW